MTTIYVGNLPFSATEQDIKVLFERHGKVDSVKLINDRETGKPRGFGFVEMGSGEAQAAIQGLNGYQMNGRPLRVNEAQERPPREMFLEDGAHRVAVLSVVPVLAVSFIWNGTLRAIPSTRDENR